MTEFLQEYPLLEGAVYMEMSGQWMALGRQVIQIRFEAPLKKVLVDGVQRPLGDVLEEVLKEHQLEISMQAEAQRSQRLLLHVFQHRERHNAERLLQAAWRGFQAVALSGRCVRHAVVRKWLILLRNSFLTWRGRVWRQHRRLQDLETMGDRHAAPIFRGLLWYAWHSWMAVVFQPKKGQELSLRQREMLLSTVKAMQDVPETYLVHELFQRWRLQVQNERRSRAEQVLLSDAGRLRRGMATVKRSASAKELLSHSLQAPEAQLSRLDTVVDQLLGQMDAVRSVCHLAGSLRLAKSGSSSPVSPGAREQVLQEALQGLGSMLEAHKAASTLRSDIHFVLCLRSFSTWARFVAEERFGRREADLGTQRSQQQVRLKTKAHLVGSRMAQMAMDLRRRICFQQWEQLVREGRTAVRSDQRNGGSQLCLRAVAKDRAMQQAQRWTAHNDEMLMQLIVERWRSVRVPVLRSSAPTAQDLGRQLALKSLVALGTSAGLDKVTEKAILHHSFKVWHLKAKSFKATVFKVASLIKGSEGLYLKESLHAWRDALRYTKTKALSYKAAAAFGDSITSCVLSNCLHTWHSMVHKERWQSLRSRSKVQALRMALCKVHMQDKVLMQLIFSRWLQAWAVDKIAEADARASRLRQMQEFSKQIFFQIIRKIDFAVIWSFFKEWHGLARLTVEERKTAAEYFRRQQLLDVERRTLRFQTEIRPKIRKSIERSVEMYEALHATEVFDQWKLWSSRNRMISDHLDSMELREREDILKFLVEAWRGGCIRVWLRGAGFRLGQAVVRWQQAAVLQQSVALWRTICVKHYAQFSVQQLFAAESLGRAIAKSQKNALRQWSMQALKIATAQMQNKVKKLDMLHLGNLFNANVGAEVEHRRWHLRTIFEAWRLGRQQMMLDRAVPKVSAAALRWKRRSVAIRRLARWRRVPEELLACLPEAFAAWVLVTIDHQMMAGVQANRCCAWRLQQRAVTMQRHQSLFRGFWGFTCARSRAASRQRVAQLCCAVEVFSTRQVLLYWSQVVHSKWKSRTNSEKRVFQAQVHGLARRVLRLAACEQSTGLLQSILWRWRQCSVKQRHLLRHQAQRSGQRQVSWETHRLKAKIFGRWSRSSFYARKESLLSPKAVTFMAWKAFLRGLREAERVQSLEGRQSQLEGPGHAALVLRMVLLRRSLQRVHFRGVEAILELRRQRQALCFGLWRLRCRFHGLHQSVMLPRLGRGLQTAMLRAAFALWGYYAERAGSAPLRRSGLVEALGRLTLRTLEGSFRELILRKVWMSWLRICH